MPAVMKKPVGFIDDIDLHDEIRRRLDLVFIHLTGKVHPHLVVDRSFVITHAKRPFVLSPEISERIIECVIYNVDSPSSGRIHIKMRPINKRSANSTDFAFFTVAIPGTSSSYHVTSHTVVSTRSAYGDISPNTALRFLAS